MFTNAVLLAVLLRAAARGKEANSLPEGWKAEPEQKDVSGSSNQAGLGGRCVVKESG